MARRGVHIRDGQIVDRLDGLVRELRETYPGRPVSREGVAREILHRGLGERPTRTLFGLRNRPR